MSDSSRHDHFTLLRVDAERALDGLRHSLAQPMADMPQAALHALDLGTALSRLGLAPEAEMLQAIGQGLSLGHPAVMSMAGDMAQDIEQALSLLAHSETPDDSTRPLLRWAQWSRQLTSASPSLSADSATGWNSLMVSTSEPLGQSQLGAPPLMSSVAQPVRQQSLDLLQHARMLNSRGDVRSRRSLDAVLAELQDRTCRLEQIPLRNLYNQPQHQVDDAWVDLDIVRALQQLQPLALRSRSIQVESRGLLLFINWSDLSLAPQECEFAGQTLNRLGGCIMPLAQGYRLCLPSSLRRMSCVAFTMASRRYAVSAAQCPSALGPKGPASSAPSDLSLHLGHQHLVLKIDTWLGSRPMNLHPIPDGVTRPEGVHHVALDAEGLVHLWFDRVE